MIRHGCPNLRWRISSSALSMIMSPIRPNQMTTGLGEAFDTECGRGPAAICDSSRAAVRPLASQYTATCQPRLWRRIGHTSEAPARRTLLCGNQSELFQTRLDGAQRASVLVSNGDGGISLLEGCDESAFLLGRPCAADIVGQLRPPLRAGG